MKMLMLTVFAVFVIGCCLDAQCGVYGLKPDVSSDRVEAPLSVPLKRIGTLEPRSAKDISSSAFTIGCEGIERGFANFEEYKDFLGALGIKRVRIQTGWAKCEKEKGRYDLKWLDDILAYLSQHGIRAMFELSYGNPIYKGGGGISLGAGFPKGEEALGAWDNWVDIMTKHFGTRVDWSVWNEPGRKGPENTAEFSIRTARLIRRNIPDAHISGLSLEHVAPEKWELFLKALGSETRLFNRFLYHGYYPAPERHIEFVEKIKLLRDKYAPGVELGQGENGCPSEMLHFLALRQYPWSEYSQGKWFLRRMLTDLKLEVPSSLFLICDLVYKGNNPKMCGINAKGLLRTNTDLEVVGVKRAYYAVQNAVSVFDDNLELVKDSRLNLLTDDLTLMTAAFRRKDNGARVFAFWQYKSIVEKKWQKYPPEMRFARPDDRFETRPLKFEYAGPKFGPMVWIDLFTGRVYEFPENRAVGKDGNIVLFDIPGYDSPCLLAERDAIMNIRSLSLNSAVETSKSAFHP